MSLKREGWDIETKSEFKLTSDPADFHITTDMTAYENGELVFHDEWVETIGRDLA